MDPLDAFAPAETTLGHHTAAIEAAGDDAQNGGRLSSSQSTLNEAQDEVNGLSKIRNPGLESRLGKASLNQDFDQTEEMEWFLTTFGPSCSPLVLLGPLCRSKKTKGMEAVRLFKLAYPSLKRPLEEIFDYFKRFEQYLGTKCYGYEYYVSEPTFDQLGWTSNCHFFRYLVPEFCELVRTCGEITNLTSMIEEPKLLIQRITACWKNLRMPLLGAEEASQMLSSFMKGLDSVMPLLADLQTSLVDAETILRKHVQEQRIAAVVTDPDKSASFTIQPTYGGTDKMQSRSRDRRPRTRASFPGTSSGFQKVGGGIKSIATLPFSWLADQWADGKFGSRLFAQVFILSLSAAAALTTGLAIWKCASAQSIPLIDSNFWSCIAQQLLGFAGLYCIVIPMLQRKGYDANNKSWFKAFLYVTFIAGVGAMPAYPFQQQTSMALAYISGLAGLLATLQLIEDQTQNIMENIETIDGLRRQVNNLEVGR